MCNPDMVLVCAVHSAGGLPPSFWSGRDASDLKITRGNLCECPVVFSFQMQPVSLFSQ